MITLTNKQNLPEAIVKACLVDNHVTRGDISVTQLIDAPQIRHLKRTNDFEEDVMGRMYALMGTAIHTVLELSEPELAEARKITEVYKILSKNGGSQKALDYLNKFIEESYPTFKDPDVLLEKTISIDVDGMTLSGTMDKFTKSTGVLEDYKNCSTYAFINEESKKKWYAQQNIYAYMLRQNGYTVNKSQVVAIFRDFSAAKQLQSKDYPKHQVAMIEIELYDDAFMKTYLSERVRLHRMAEDGNVPECNGKERWATNDKFAMMNKGGKRAIRVLNSKAEAEEWRRTEAYKYDNLYEVKRPGENKRCEKFCGVKDVCPQFKRIMKEASENTTTEFD